MSSHRPRSRFPQTHVWCAFLFFAIASPLLRTQAVPAPTGWTASTAGSSATYKPENLPPGKIFLLTIPPPQPLAGQPLAAWFTAQVQADLRQRGAQGRPGNPQANPDGSLLMLVPYKDSAGQSWTAIYSAVSRPEGAAFCSMVSNLPPQEMKTYIRPGAMLFGETVKQTRTTSAPSSSQGAGLSSGSVGATQPSTQSPVQTPSQPGVGAAGSKIASLFHEGRGMSTPTGYQYVESVDLLLTDGWEYSGLTGPPEDLNPEASRRAEPQKWHHWRQQNGAVYLEVNGAWSRLEADKARPLESGSALNKHLVHRKATTFVGMGGTVGTDRISFFPNGHFERSANVLAGSGAVQSAGGFSGGASTLSNSRGTTAASSGAYSGGGGSVTARSSRTSMGGAGAASGAYKISGYTLELDCANGQVQRLLAFYPFPGKPQIYIGNITFSVE